MSRTIAGVATALLMLVPATATADEAEFAREARLARRLPPEDVRALGGGVDYEPIVRESDVDGTTLEAGEQVGLSLLVRRSHGLYALEHIRGLRPDGVYTFWWVVAQGPGAFPDDIFVASGGGVVVGDSGRATMVMSASTGQPGITGFAPDGATEVAFASLEDPLRASVRVEVAYHGQVGDAGAGLSAWLADFWTGLECPPETPNPNPDQPHCPVYFAATHT